MEGWKRRRRMKRLEKQQQQHRLAPSGTSLQLLRFHIKASKVPFAVLSEAEDLPAAVRLFEVAAGWLPFLVGCKEQRPT